MKIIILSNSTGGLVLFRSEMIKKLKSMHNEVFALSPFGYRVNDLRNLGVEIIDTPTSRRGTNPVVDFELIKTYFRILRGLNPDLIITYTVKPNIYGGIVARLLKIPYATNITGLGTSFESNTALRALVIWLYRVALKSARVIFCENAAIKEKMQNLHIAQEKKLCVLNGAGVDIIKFSYLKYPDNTSIVKFLFIGRVMKEKGIDELLESMKRLNHKRLVCCLTIIGRYEEDYSMVFDQYKDTGWLEYLGIQTDVRPYIKESHCSVLPSWHEGMANTNLECAASGRPIITSNVPGCKEAVIDGVSGYTCRVKDADDLYAKMKKMTELSRDERVKMGIAGRKHMEKNFDKQLVVAKTIQALFDDANG